MNEGINLLDPNKNARPTALVKRLQTMRVVTIGLLFIVSVASVILFILVALSPLPALQQQEQSLQNSLALSKNDIVELALVNAQTDAIGTVIKQRQTIDVPLGLVEDKLSGDMSVTELRTDKKSLIVTVESTSLQSFDDFFNGLVSYVQNKKSFSRVTLVDLTTDQITNSYAATIQLDML